MAKSKRGFLGVTRALVERQIAKEDTPALCMRCKVRPETGAGLCDECTEPGDVTESGNKKEAGQ